MFVLKTRTKYWDLVEYPANRKHMQSIKILDAGAEAFSSKVSWGRMQEDKEQLSHGGRKKKSIMLAVMLARLFQKALRSYLYILSLDLWFKLEKPGQFYKAISETKF